MFATFKNGLKTESDAFQKHGSYNRQHVLMEDIDTKLKRNKPFGATHFYSVNCWMNDGLFE